MTIDVIYFSPIGYNSPILTSPQQPFQLFRHIVPFNNTPPHAPSYPFDLAAASSSLNQRAALVTNCNNNICDQRNGGQVSGKPPQLAGNQTSEAGKRFNENTVEKIKDDK